MQNVMVSNRLFKVNRNATLKRKKPVFANEKQAFCEFYLEDESKST